MDFADHGYELFSGSLHAPGKKLIGFYVADTPGLLGSAHADDTLIVIEQGLFSADKQPERRARRTDFRAFNSKRSQTDIGKQMVQRRQTQI